MCDDSTIFSSKIVRPQGFPVFFLHDLFPYSHSDSVIAFSLVSILWFLSVGKFGPSRRNKMASILGTKLA